MQEDSKPVSVKVTETTTVEAQPQRPDNWRTLLLVGLIYGIGIVFAAYALMGPRWGTFCTVLISYEAWTLINAYREDTISEAIWILARRPISVFLFTIAIGYGWGSAYFGDVKAFGRGLAIGTCCGHFFWQMVTEMVHTRRSRVKKGE